MSNCLSSTVFAEFYVQNSILYLQPYPGAMQLGKVGPAWHGIELWLRLDQIYDSFASIAWQRGSALFQQLDNSSCITLPAYANLWCSDMSVIATCGKLGKSQELMLPHGERLSFSRICDLCWQQLGCALYNRPVKTTPKIWKMRCRIIGT